MRRVGEHVAVVGEEDLVVLEVGPHPAQPLTDRGVDAGVDEGDRPVADVGASISTCWPPLVSTKSFELVSPVVEEVVLDRVGAVAQAQDELGVAEVRVVAHHVPEHRPAADRHHRLGQGLVPARIRMPEPTAEQHDLHVCLPPAQKTSSSGQRHDEAAAPLADVLRAARRSPFRRFQGMIST